MAEIKWKCIEHKLSRVHGGHPILIGYEKIRLGLGTVRCVSPLYDLRDLNLDGAVSGPEWFFTAGIVGTDPYELNSLIGPMGEFDFKIQAGGSVWDPEFVQKAQDDFLRKSFEVVKRAAVTIAVEKILGPGIGKTLAATGLSKMSSIGTPAVFLIQAGLETVIMEAVAATR